MKKKIILPIRLRSPKSIIQYIIDNKGDCGTIHCMYCPIYKPEKSCTDKSKYIDALIKGVELKIIKKTDMFELLL